jgi:hypothetical protein
MPIHDPFERATPSRRPVRKESPSPLAPVPELDERPDLLAAIETRCLALFERWCENRHVLPLAYLMHVWPIPKPNSRLTQRLASALHDLRTSHADSLDSIDHQLIHEALDIIDRTLQR